MYALVSTFILLSVPRSDSATFTVTNETELATAITSANAIADGDIIDITTMGTITLTAPLPNITTNMIIQASGPASFTLSGGGAFRIFFVESGIATFTGMTIDSGLAQGSAGANGSFGGAGGGSAGMGGGIFVNSGAEVTLDDVIVSNCMAVGGNGGDSSAGASRGGAGGAGLGGNGNLPATDDGGDGGIATPFSGTAGTGGTAGTTGTGGTSGGAGNIGTAGGLGAGGGGGGTGGDVSDGAGLPGFGGTGGAGGFGAGAAGGGAGGDAEPTGADDGATGGAGNVGGFGAGGGGGGAGGSGGASGMAGVSGAGGSGGSQGGAGGDAGTTGGAGGGGGGLGGAAFVRVGGALRILNATFNNNSTMGGTGGLGQTAPEDGSAGLGKGGAIFMEPGAVVGFRIITFSGNIAPDNAGTSTDTNDVFGVLIFIPTFGSTSSCFIATAAYGTPVAGELDTLRQFRDAYLLEGPGGAAFVDAYYRLSPPVADLVARSPGLASMVRAALVPITFATNILLSNSGVGLVLMLVFAGIAAILVLRAIRLKTL